MTGEVTKPTIKNYFVADLKCYLCGAIAGVVESEHQPLPRTVEFRQADSRASVSMIEWRRLRCERCGGPTYLDDPDVISRRVEQYNWLEERPRRGRPPKRLVEERRRERELLEQQRAA